MRGGKRVCLLRPCLFVKPACKGGAVSFFFLFFLVLVAGHTKKPPTLFLRCELERSARTFDTNLPQENSNLLTNF